MGASATATVRTPSQFAAVLTRTGTQPGPWVIIAKVQETYPTTKPSLDYVFIKQRFMSAIGQPEAVTSGGAA
jgi:hypothetical protein